MKKLIAHTKDTITFLAGKKKQERELAICRAFLRCIGTDFSHNDFVISETEPPDVLFKKQTRFEVIMLLESGRKLHKEWKDKHVELSEINSVGQLIEPYIPPCCVDHQTLIQEIVGGLIKKSEKYEKNYNINKCQYRCCDLDALVYVNRSDRCLNPDFTVLNVDMLKQQGWRSVSVLFPPYGIVLLAEASAPEFLRAISPCQKSEWKSIDTLFDL